jgi:hypothetical protein
MSKKTQSKYKQKLARRNNIAKKLGGKGYYTVSVGKNKGKRYPKPMPILKRLLAQREEKEENQGE